MGVRIEKRERGEWGKGVVAEGGWVLSVLFVKCYCCSEGFGFHGYTSREQRDSSINSEFVMGWFRRLGFLTL